MDDNAAKQTILEKLRNKTGTKTKFYLRDFYEILPGMKPKKVKDLVNQLVQEGKLEYWSSGSTTLIGLTGAGKQHQEE